MAWQRTVTHNNDNISDNYDNDDDDNGHSHREQHPHTAPESNNNLHADHKMFPKAALQKFWVITHQYTIVSQPHLLNNEGDFIIPNIDKIPFHSS